MRDWRVARQATKELRGTGIKEQLESCFLTICQGRGSESVSRNEMGKVGVFREREM